MNTAVNIIRSLFILVAFGFLNACCVHQWPEPNGEPSGDVQTPGNDKDPDEEPGDEPGNEVPEVKPTLSLKLAYEPDFYVWEHKYDPVLGKIEELYPGVTYYPEHPGTTSRYDNTLQGSINHITVRVYNAVTNACVAEHSVSRTVDYAGYDTTVEIELEHDTEYYVAVWSHLLERPDLPSFYDPSDFNSVKLIKETYRANTDYRDAFRGRTDKFIISRSDKEVDVAMKRPMGKYELITTDLSEFLDNETKLRNLSSRASASDYTVTIQYSGYYTTAYDVLLDELRGSETGWSFSTAMTVTGESEASIGCDYLLKNDAKEGGAQINIIVVRNDTGETVASVAGLSIPVIRNRHTRLTGTFLSMQGNGGVGIDPGFNGDHNVTIQ